MASRSSLWTSEQASALSTVLVFIVVVSIVVGLILLVQVLQHRFVKRDAHRLQARYAAEAGVYRALAELDGDLRSLRTRYEVEGADRCSVWVEPFGGFARVHAWATVGGQRIGLRALAAERPPRAFDTALMLGDPRSSLTLTGGTHIGGTVLVGERGVETRDFRGELFAGAVGGEVRRRPDVALPAYDTTAYQRTLERADELLRAPPPEGNGGAGPERKRGISEEGETPSPRNSRGAAASPEDRATPLTTADRQVRAVRGDGALTAADRDFLQEPVVVRATGDLTLRGDVAVPPGSIFLAGQTLTVAGPVDGRDALFYGRDTVRVTSSGRLSGQFLSRRVVQLAGETHLQYPSVAYTGAQGGIIRLSERAQLDGLVLSPFVPLDTQDVQRDVVLSEAAHVRGGIYNGAQTELWGRVHGSVLTQQFGFYRSPTHYVNWLKDATVRRSGRPDPFLVPYGFHASDREEDGDAEGGGQATVLRWHVISPRSGDPADN